MSSKPGNPFVFPGIGLGLPSGDPSSNPILQSMEMMRQAWTNMGGSTPFSNALSPSAILDPDELDRRIQELQAVASWLRLNLNMLQGTIQALEVQRATIATLRSFATLGTGAASATGAQGGSSGSSPLDIALAAKPGPRRQAKDEPAAAAAPEAPAEDDAPQAGGEDEQSAQASPQQMWWNLLQNQFNQIAQAAAATLPSTKPRAAKGATAKSAAKTAGTGAARKSASAPRKAARKSAARKTSR